MVPYTCERGAARGCRNLDQAEIDHSVTYDSTSPPRIVPDLVLLTVVPMTTPPSINPELVMVPPTDAQEYAGNARNGLDGLGVDDGSAGDGSPRLSAPTPALVELEATMVPELSTVPPAMRVISSPSFGHDPTADATIRPPLLMLPAALTTVLAETSGSGENRGKVADANVAMVPVLAKSVPALMLAET